MAEPRTDTGSTPKLSNPNAQQDDSAANPESTLEHLNKPDAHLTQFPSLHGQPGVEIAERTTDTDKSATKFHRKIFRIFTDGYDFDESTFDHTANFMGTRQFMVDHGLRPVGDVKFTGSQPFDARNTDLIYEVEALPTVVAIDTDAALVTVPQDNPPTAA